MLRSSHSSRRNRAFVVFLSTRFPPSVCWSLVTPPEVQYRSRCSSSSRWNSGSSSGVNLGWCRQQRTLQLSSKADRAEGRQEQQRQRHQLRRQEQRRVGCRLSTDVAERSLLPPLMMAGPAVAAAGGVGGEQRAQQLGQLHEDKEEELVLDRDFFSKEMTVVAVKLPAKRTSELRARLKKELMNVPRRQNVERCPGDDSRRLLLLSPAVKDPGTLEGLSEETAAFLHGDDELEITTHVVKTDYSMLGVEEVLKALLEPRLPGRDLPTSFEVAGHLAHLNLRDYLLPYKRVIGQVIIDKNQRVTTVVNKVDTISTQFRTFPMEIVAGEPNTQVVVKESGCSFRFDFAKVYWNSRLQTEHARLIRVIGQQKPPAVVCDMMAGVGPFAVPLAKNGHRVFANDLNPDSYRALRENGSRNKVAGRMTSSNECGRAFARRLIRQRQVFHHAILNLPDSALTFLDTFRGVDWKANGFEGPPTVHVYCFSKAADFKQDALDRANQVMGSSLTQREVKIHVVRDVAPNKPMLCLSFLAPDAGDGGGDAGGPKGEETEGAEQEASRTGGGGGDDEDEKSEVEGASTTACNKRQRTDAAPPGDGDA
ncbi:unnamed protein product [Scytosiphon promiscuus]